MAEFAKSSGLELSQGRLSRRGLLAGLGLAAVGFTLEGCGKDGRSGATATDKLNFYTWDTYIGENTLSSFAEATGIRVQTSYFPTNEFVTRMRQADMLLPLDTAALPNLKNIAPEFLGQDYDPAPKHSVPYTWLVLGIGYRKSRVNGVPDSWKWLFDSDLYKGRIALNAESADLMRLGARYLVEEMLIRQKPNIKTFHEDNGQDLLLAGDVDLVLEPNGDIAQIALEDNDIGFVVPREGSLLNADTLAIPKGAPRPEQAHKFINYLLDAQAGKHIIETILYPTPNTAAKALMPASYANNPIIFPTGPGMEASEWGKYEGPERARAFEEAFTRVRAA
jgi:spermidine/putrescine transport system substrate-binding protein